MEKHSPILEDELIEDAPGHSLTAGSTPAITALTVHAPVWLQLAYDRVNKDLQNMAHVIQKLVDGGQDPNDIAPGIVATYYTHLKQQNMLLQPQSEDFETVRCIDYI